jgi:hypothetical protein
MVCATLSFLTRDRTKAVLKRFETAFVESGQKTKLHLLPNSGHWVNVDNPIGLCEIMEHNLSLKPSQTE